MKNIRILLAILALTFSVATVTVVTGCKTPTQQKQAVNTLFTIHKTADAALDTYLDLMIAGKVSTNSLPHVMTSYNTFQVAYSAAVNFVSGNVNASVPQNVLDSAAALSATIGSVKKEK